MPLLLIDDEADNASVDTRQQRFNHGVADPNHRPTAINAKIRQILRRFDQASYVGYTATPFANIFIHPDAETGAEFQDLFPRDFIINIPSPENYVGAVRIFGVASDNDDVEDSPGLPALIEEIDDYALSTARRETHGWMPPLHKSDHLPLYEGESRIPPSLDRAIRSFALVIAARRARGQTRNHNSMLIHVTRFQAVQRRVVQQIQEALDVLVNEVRYGGAEAMRELQTLWQSEFAPVTAALEFSDCPTIPWVDIEPALRATVETIRVREISGRARLRCKQGERPQCHRGRW
jgi:murein DD-endopeptidase MepM/ murein hydrolase activator NlpD